MFFYYLYTVEELQFQMKCTSYDDEIKRTWHLYLFGEDNNIGAAAL